MALSRSWGMAFIVLGAVQLILALVIIICTFVIYKDVPNMLSSPVYAGFPYLIPGVMGIVAGATRKNSGNPCSVVASMILNIVMSIFMYVVAIIMTTVSLLHGTGSVEGRCEDTANNGCDCGSIFTLPYGCSKVESVRALTTGVAILCYICCALSLGVSILGCANACCGRYCPASKDDESNFTVAMAPLRKGVIGESSPSQYQGVPCIAS